MKSSSQRLKRVRPLLGTYVEIELLGTSHAELNRSLTAAFDTVSEIDRLMSVHRPDSDLGRLNRAKAGAWVSVDPMTVDVLALANELFVSSDGLFDIRCGRALAEWNIIPSVLTPTSGKPIPLHRVPVEISGRRVRKTGDWLLDLGGIAKGFAVDCAIETLRARGVRAGLVNAGGDLRAFGPHDWPVSIRHPKFPTVSLALAPLRNGAMSTSAVYFSKKKSNGRWVSAIVRPEDGKPFLKGYSVTVASGTCVMADALTKVVALAPGRSGLMLKRLDSFGFIARMDGTVRSIN